jgi:hypothetical protein
MSVSTQIGWGLGYIAGRYGATFYVAECQDCTPVLPQPFSDPAERARWTETHREATGHVVVIRDEVRSP